MSKYKFGDLVHFNEKTTWGSNYWYGSAHIRGERPTEDGEGIVYEVTLVEIYDNDGVEFSDKLYSRLYILAENEIIEGGE
ncbi:hypothetical protein [Salmonella phage SSBI34]|nr:hypothetical protein [Salmonella phage SSBI34]